MREFEINDRYTVSDIGVSLRADSLTELFIAGAEGMFGIIMAARPDRPAVETQTIVLHADTVEQLMIDWLSELLYGFDTRGLIPVHFDISVSETGKDSRISGTVGYCRFDRDADNAEHEIKAVTYYKLKIEKVGDLYRCDVVFDL
jgi:SHS2 domain-containing protein